MVIVINLSIAKKHFMLSVVRLNVVRLNVVAPLQFGSQLILLAACLCQIRPDYGKIKRLVLSKCVFTKLSKIKNTI